jgi:predicted FMN-binding regulatory protein PaiB
MYLPARFAASEPDLADTPMRAHPFASLISMDEAGEPFVTHLPLHPEQRRAQRVPLGHCARANLHGRLLQARPRALGEDFAHRMLGGIVAFELPVERIECKIKLNQHRPESHAAMHATHAGGDDNARALAGWLARIGPVGAGQSAEGRP